MRFNPSLNGAKIFGPNPTHTRQDGWRKLCRNHVLLIQEILKNQGTMRLAKVVPDWSNFMQTGYYSAMLEFMDSGMARKVRAWWDLLFHISARLDTAHGKMALHHALSVLTAESMKRRHGKDPGPLSHNGISAEEAGQIRDQVLSRYEDLTLS